jgi:poly(3-hydroxybutyrate) depolymerase
MHGSGSTPERQILLSRMAALADQGAVVAFPQGSTPLRYGSEWDLERDGALLDASVDYLRATFGAATVPLGVTGMSGGARMASTEVTAKLSRLAYGPQDDPGAVTLWVCDGAGHTWPGTRLTLRPRLILGKVSYEVDASAEIARALLPPS